MPRTGVRIKHAPVGVLPELPAPVPHAPGDTVRTKGEHTASTVELIQRAVELRRAGLPYRQIGELMGVSTGRAHQLVRTAKREAIMTASESMIEHELAQLELIRAKALEILNEYAPLVNAGRVIEDTVIDPATGLPQIDPRTGKELKVKLRNRAPALAALSQLVAVSAEIRKLRGVDAPKQVAHTVNPGAGSPVPWASREEFTADMAHVLEMDRLRRRGLPAPEVVDVEARTVAQGDQDEQAAA